MTFLRLSSIRKTYGDVVALAGADLDVEAGSHTAIVGPSASGKSTLLRVIAGFERPDAGEVMLAGQVLVDDRRMVPAHRRRIGYVAQDGALFPHLSVEENVGFGIPKRDRDRSERIAGLMTMVGLDASAASRRPDQLSGGQQQRVAIARALAQRPQLMLLDEPFSALDASLRIATRKAISDVLKSAGITTILVTHDQPEALSFADHVAVVQAGAIVQSATPRELYERPRTAAIATLLGDAVLLRADIVDEQATCALGRLRVEDGPNRGAATIMLRPEQIRLTVITQPESQIAANRIVGQVVHVDFCGGGSEIAVRMLSGETASVPAEPILLRHSGGALPQVGNLVEIRVEGNARVVDI
jgi:iron(III) transport system ATP-binding protein